MPHRVTPVRARGFALALCGVLLAGALAPALRAQEVKSIKPGMTEAEVREAWGEPLTVRKNGDRAYMYYQTDCLKRCGTYDVVFLEGGQVVDAIVRASGHSYEGTSSSPEGRKPEYTRP